MTKQKDAGQSIEPPKRLWRLFPGLLQTNRRVAGLMSGTSLDGIDVVVADLVGSGTDLEIDVLCHAESPFPDEIRAYLLANSAPGSSSVQEISQLNVRIAALYADAVHRTLTLAAIDPASIDLVGSHGQTIHHVPDAVDFAGHSTTSTLQIGDASVLANLLGVPVVANFRLADMALGGQGAPLVPYFDYVCFSHATENRLLLNLGGIGNVTVLPAGGDAGDTVAFDTGPGNMVLDALATRLLDRPFDEDGKVAMSGTADQAVVDALLRDAYFGRKPPKSTGRERFGEEYVNSLIARMPDARAEDMLATATALTVQSISHAVERFVRLVPAPDRLIVSGGGMRNDAIMRGLEAALAPVSVDRVTAYGVHSESKEALCFAVLAHEYMNGVPTNMPSVTGASRQTLLGQLAFPYPTHNNFHATD